MGCDKAQRRVTRGREGVADVGSGTSRRGHSGDHPRTPLSPPASSIPTSPLVGAPAWGSPRPVGCVSACQPLRVRLCRWLCFHPPPRVPAAIVVVAALAVALGAAAAARCGRPTVVAVAVSLPPSPPPLCFLCHRRPALCGVPLVWRDFRLRWRALAEPQSAALWRHGQLAPRGGHGHGRLLARPANSR